MTLAKMVCDHAESHPGAPLLRWESETYSYRDAAGMIRRVAGWLRGPAELGAGDRVAVFLGNRPEYIWTWLGAHAAGAVAVTLNREHRGVVLRDMVSRMDPAVLVTDTDGLEILREGDAIGSAHIVLLDDAETAGATPFAMVLAGPEEAPLDLAEADPATIIFTSGTTGRSKAVEIPHGMYLRGSRHLVDAIGIDCDDVLHCWLPLFHVAAQLDLIAVAITSGGSVALYPRFSRSAFWSQMRDSEATAFIAFVSILEMLWAAEPSPEDRLHQLRFGVVGHVPAALQKPFEERFGVQLFDVYGLTEAEPLSLPRADEEVPPGSCGRPNPDFDLMIRAADDTPAPFGQLGEIVVRPRRDGVMMRRYADDVGPGGAGWHDGWFHTGDIGRVDEDGFLYFAERKGDLIRVRGENVSSHEVELALYEHPEIVDVAVVGIESELGEHEVKAFLVTRDSTLPDDLEAWCEGRMARFMVPRHYAVVPELPRTETGKVRRGLLRNGER